MKVQILYGWRPLEVISVDWNEGVPVDGSFIHEATCLLQVDVFFRIVFHLSLSIHSPNVSWNLKKWWFPKPEISYSFRYHFQVFSCETLGRVPEPQSRYILRGVHVLLCVFYELAQKDQRNNPMMGWCLQSSYKISNQSEHSLGGGGFKDLSFSSLPGKMIEIWLILF